MSDPEPTPIWSPRWSSDNHSSPSGNRNRDQDNQNLIRRCEEILLFTQWAQKEGHITEQGRYRINESVLQENFIKIHLRGDALAQIAPGSQMGSMSTSVTVAVAGERSSVVQTRDIVGSSVVTGDGNKVSTNSPLNVDESATRRSQWLSERVLSIMLAFIFGVVFVAALLIFVIIIPNPTDQQFEVIRIVLALAAGGIAAVIPGFLDLRLGVGSKLAIRAGGALAVFVVVYFYSPAHWTGSGQASINEQTEGAK
jgi:transcription elongation GreA/GreB family factor